MAITAAMPITIPSTVRPAHFVFSQCAEGDAKR